jgi:predicted anti-sigma-YlaC factor YlaD
MDEPLEKDEAKSLERHLASCSACRAFKDDLVRMRTFFAADETPEAPPDLRERIVANVLPALSSQRRRLFWRGLSRLSAAALILAAVTAGFFILDGNNTMQATDANREIHYEDLFQRDAIQEREVLELLLKTGNPREALRVYSETRKP